MTIRKKLRCRRGMSQYISFLVVLFMLMTVIAASLDIAELYTMKKSLDNVATETARYIELRGAVNDAVYSEFERLKATVGPEDATLTVDGDFSSGNTLQLEAPFTVTVSDTGNLFLIEIPLIGKATGRSEVYKK